MSGPSQGLKAAATIIRGSANTLGSSGSLSRSSMSLRDMRREPGTVHTVHRADGMSLTAQASKLSTISAKETTSTINSGKRSFFGTCFGGRARSIQDVRKSILTF